MAKTQPIMISPQVAGEAGAADFASALQQNYKALFQWAHDHGVKTEVPTLPAGAPGDICPVEVNGDVYLAVRTSSGWYRTQRLQDSVVDAVWDDLRFPAQGINPAGSASPPTVDTTDGMFLFNSVTNNVIAGVAQMPHGWKLGTAIRPHIHWCKTTSATGNVLWELEYKWVNNGDVIPGAFTGPLTTTDPIPTQDTANLVGISTFGNINADGKELSSLFFWKVTRNAASGSDTYGADAKLIEFDIHFQKDTDGSETQFEKDL